MTLPGRLLVETGAPQPLGATWDGAGVQFALPSRVAERVEICLFADPGHAHESARVTLPGKSGDVFHGRVAGLLPGQAYGVRVHGPWDPERGLRCAPAKLLVDPWARALAGPLRWDDALFDGAGHAGARAPDRRDSAPCVPRALVVDPGPLLVAPRRPAVPWSETLIYEAQVRALTAQHPELPPALRGTYLGLASEPVIGHLKALGVTTLELLPVQTAVSERRLVAAGLSNAWGYNPLGLMAPDARFSSEPSGRTGAACGEFREMVRRLHDAGIEVILDVVFNHSCEGGADGPTLSWRGLDNGAFYLADPEAPGRLVDVTGCGNTLRTATGPGRDLLRDALRRWVVELGVDGFRFDLATALARHDGRSAPEPELLSTLADDPLLAGVKFIAEPWDLGPGGWRQGAFPPRWAEWNGRFRDEVRSFWRGDRGARRGLAARLAGSADLFGDQPARSVHFVTCHDGFTLADLVSHERKHNLTNGEGNRDGSDDNRSQNFGVEGPTDDPTVVARRERCARSLLACLHLSRGVPMLLMGDEFLRSQAGNNNAYCHDGPLTWVPWRRDGAAAAMLAFARRLAALRPRLGPLVSPDAGPQVDLAWIDGHAAPLDERAWADEDGKLLGLLASDRCGGGRWLLYANAADRPQACRIPGGSWEWLLDTSQPEGGLSPLASGASRVDVADRALVLLHQAPVAS